MGVGGGKRKRGEKTNINILSHHFKDKPAAQDDRFCRIFWGEEGKKYATDIFRKFLQTSKIWWSRKNTQTRKLMVTAMINKMGVLITSLEHNGKERPTKAFNTMTQQSGEKTDKLFSQWNAQEHKPSEKDKYK